MRAADLDEALCLEEDVARHRAQNGLLAFTRATYGPGWHTNWHHRAICRAVNYTVAGKTPRDLLASFGVVGRELKRQLNSAHPVTKLFAGMTSPEMLDKPLRNLQVHVAPRHGKSEIISRRMPAWLLGRNPNLQIISCSYGAELSQAMNRDVQRIIDDQAYAEIFPKTKLRGGPKGMEGHGNYLRTSDIFEIVGGKGFYKNSGVGGGITGMGANCVVGDVLVETEQGPRRIADLAASRTWPLVWSYDERTRTCKLRRILAVRKTRATKVVTTSFSNGRQITCTPEHLFYTKTLGYQPAWSLANQRGSSRPWWHFCTMRQMLKGIFASNYASQKTIAGRGWRYVLQFCLSSRRIASVSAATCRFALSKMWSNVCADKPSDENVLAGLRQRDALRENARQNKSKLPSWQTSKLLSHRPFAFSHAQVGQVSRWRQVCNLQAKYVWKSICQRSSHRRRQNKQHVSQFDNTLQFVSLDGAQAKYVRCESVSPARQEEHEVFDIQVEELGNFFANSICISNCAIIDDPFKNRKQAESAVERQTVKDWYASTLYTRLERNACQIIINTRWHERDLSGTVIAQAQADHAAEQWFCLVFPAVLDCDPAPGDPRVKHGTALWPWKADEKRLARIRSSTSAYEFESLFQQRPAPPEGGIVKTSWFNFYDTLPGGLTNCAISADLTFKDRGDYCCFQVWGEKGADKYLLDMVRERLTFTQQLQTFRSLCAKWPQARLKLIEDAANGAALIDTVKREIGGVVGVRPEGSKEMRLDAVSPMIEAGNVHLPNVSRAKWVEILLEEVRNFPHGSFDDTIDAMSMALWRMMKKRSFGAGAAPLSVGKQSYWDGFGNEG